MFSGKQSRNAVKQTEEKKCLFRLLLNRVSKFDYKKWVSFQESSGML